MKQFSIGLVLLAAFAGQAFAAEFMTGGPGVLNINAAPTACAAFTCAAGDTCQCITLAGKLSDGKYAGKSFSTVMSVDTTYPARQYPQGNNSVCFMGASSTAITVNPKATLTVKSSGLACNYAATDFIMTSGGFALSGTDSISKATGTGVQTMSGKDGAGVIYLRGLGTGF